VNYKSASAVLQLDSERPECRPRRCADILLQPLRTARVVRGHRKVCYVLDSKGKPGRIRHGVTPCDRRLEEGGRRHRAHPVLKDVPLP
jgi:hypothetical protein